MADHGRPSAARLVALRQSNRPTQSASAEVADQALRPSGRSPARSQAVLCSRDERPTRNGQPTAFAASPFLRMRARKILGRVLEKLPESRTALRPTWEVQ